MLKNKIIVAFHIYSNFDNHCILSHSIFLGLNYGHSIVLGLNLESFYFFGWLKFVLGGASLSKKCLCIPLGIRPGGESEAQRPNSELPCILKPLTL